MLKFCPKRPERVRSQLFATRFIHNCVKTHSDCWDRVMSTPNFNSIDKLEVMEAQEAFIHSPKLPTTSEKL